jgi:hypothetical protein
MLISFALIIFWLNGNKKIKISKKKKSFAWKPFSLSFSVLSVFSVHCVSEEFDSLIRYFIVLILKKKNSTYCFWLFIHLFKFTWSFNLNKTSLIVALRLKRKFLKIKLTASYFNLIDKNNNNNKKTTTTVAAIFIFHLRLSTSLLFWFCFFLYFKFWSFLFKWL